MLLEEPLLGFSSDIATSDARTTRKSMILGFSYTTATLKK